MNARRFSTVIDFHTNNPVTRQVVEDMLAGYIRWPMGITLAAGAVAISQWGTSIQIKEVLNKVDEVKLDIKRLDAKFENLDARFDVVGKRFDNLETTINNLRSEMRRANK